MAWAPQRPWLVARHAWPTTSGSAGPTPPTTELWRALERVDLASDGGRPAARAGRRRSARTERDSPPGSAPGSRWRVWWSPAALRLPRRADRTPRRGHRGGVPARPCAGWRSARQSSSSPTGPRSREAADRVLSLPATSDHAAAARPTGATEGGPTAPVPRAAPTRPTRPLAHRRRGPPGRRGGVVLGTSSVASGVALTATAAWLITRASEHPPVLHADGGDRGVRTFGLARPALRYSERLVSHDAALRLLAERGPRCTTCWSRWCPGGWACAEATCSPPWSTTSTPSWTSSSGSAAAVDRRPGRCGATAFAAVVSPVPGLVALVVPVGVAGVAASHGGRRRGPSRLRPRPRASCRHGWRRWWRVRASSTLWQAVALRWPPWTGTASGGSSAAGPRPAGWLRDGRWSRVGCGRARWRWRPSYCRYASPAMLALLVLLPLALGEARCQSSTPGRCPCAPGPPGPGSRVDRAGTRPSPNRGPAAAPARSTDARRRTRHGGLGRADVVRGLSFDAPARAAGSGWSARPARASRRSRRCCIRFLDPRRGAVLLSGIDLRALALDDTPRGRAGRRRPVRLRVHPRGERPPRPARRRRRRGRGRPAAGAPRALARPLPDGLAHPGRRGPRLGVRRRAGAHRHRPLDPGRPADARAGRADRPPRRRAPRGRRRRPADGERGRSLVWITHGTVGLDAMDKVIRRPSPTTRRAARTPLPSRRWPARRSMPGRAQQAWTRRGSGRRAGSAPSRRSGPGRRSAAERAGSPGRRGRRHGSRGRPRTARRTGSRAAAARTRRR